jgi:CheY-like chemotaxis protein
MSAEYLAHIFEEFSRENTSTANKIEGTGLGMPIVKRLVELMGGTIRVSSEKGVGTTFVVTLPHRIADEIEDAEPENVVADETVFEGKRILLAEDNDLNAEIAEEILTSAGFMIERAEDGAICYEKIVSSETGYYDLVLMDIQMPNMDGYQATRAIRALADKEKANIPIIAMTANAFEEDRSKAINMGMNGHIAKPIDVSELLMVLARVIVHKER